MFKKNLLVIGSSGMIGLSFLEKIANDKKNKFKITVLCKKIKSFNKIKKKIDDVRFIKIDLSQSKSFKNIKCENNFFAVIYMASTKINFNYDFKFHVEKNLKIAENILNFLSKKKIKHLIFTNSSAIYKPGNNLSENSEIGNNPYGLSKYITSNYLKNYCLVNKIYFKDLRIFSVFGEWEKSDRLVAGSIQSALKKKFFYVKHPNQFRDYLHTDDVVDAIIKSIYIKKTISVNICSGNKIGTHSLVSLIFDKLSNKNLIRFNKIFIKKKNSNNFLKNMTGDNKYAKKILDWSPKHDIESGINLILKRKYIL